MTNKTGLVKISFSRAVIINLDIPEDETDGTLKGRRRSLKETYNAEEKLKLADIIKIEYETDADED